MSRRQRIVLFLLFLLLLVCWVLWQFTPNLDLGIRPSLVLGVGGLLGTLSPWVIQEFSKTKSTESPDITDDERKLSTLAKAVKSNWVDGVLESSIYKQFLLSIDKTSTAEAVKHPWHRVMETVQLHEDIT